MTASARSTHDLIHDPRWGDDPRDRDDDDDDDDDDDNERHRDRDDDSGLHLARGPSSREDNSDADTRHRDDARWSKRDRDGRERANRSSRSRWQV